MARYFQLMARVFCVGAIIVIAAIASRQAYLRSTAEADQADADEEPATMMMIRCETMHARLQSRHPSAADAEERPRARCRES
ncbi:hypothetical protein CNE_BB1p06920 (plasmid) [Cupriavidus necator N-1]|uniref:Uncharacterized protein n=1 Tax=Cupriavidus necator (strain ATCC 43291 / DSM 13513 / CCUG 52238 / LMG 8453 / N-1) TaxID=1042878 RepID=F8GXP2_CUPNN|nr:hypothetical protein CNE_BB1p06920 [Cupriavidus necator N-1]KAI3611144.1 hypothetical protein D8I24_0293 [Cupriavidus necator H850]